MKITEKAYAKINLSLDVLGRYPNGYHQVAMIMQTIGLHDELELWEAEEVPAPGDPRILLSLSEEWDPQQAMIAPQSMRALSTGPDNLIVRAGERLLEACAPAYEGQIRILLKKRIPVAAGMAGGSTDAAAALRGINRLLRLGCSDQQLCEIGAALGADIPYCIRGGTALAEGIGEILTPLSPCPELVLALAKPAVGVSTAEVYRDLDRNFERVTHPQVEAMRAVIDGKPADGRGILPLLGNVLETVTIPKCPVVGQIRDRFLQLGAQAALMSGSGPTVFAVCETEELARSIAERMRAEGLAEEVCVTRTIRPVIL